MDLRALKKGGDELKSLQAWVVKSHSLVWMWVILTGVIIFIGSVVVVCCVYRKELVRLWQACHSVHENSAHWRRRPTEQQNNYQDQIQELRELILSQNKREENENDRVSERNFDTVSTAVDLEDEDDKSLVFLQ